MRKFVQMLSLVALAAPLDINAIGLGDINVRSGLNQSLNAEIELISVRPDELESLSVTLASGNAFAQAGLDRPPFLNQLRFQVETKGDGKPYLHVYTQEPVKEPFLNYLVEVNWASGHLLREYTVLLDPSSALPATAPVIQAPIVSSTSTLPSIPRSKSLFEPSLAQQPKASAPSAAQSRPSSARIKTTDQGTSYGPTQAGEGLWGIAKILLAKEDAANINQLMLALLKANPEAFLDNNVNTVRAGFVLRVPAPDEIIALSQGEAMRLVIRHNARWEDPAYRLALNTGALARSSATEENVVPNPVEVAPVEAPESTAQLKLVPALDDLDADLTPVSQTSATVGQPAANQAVAPSDDPNGALDLSQTTDTAQPEVNAVADSVTKPSSAEDVTQTTDIERLSKELVLANESLETKRLENEELSSRLAELEARTESIQRLVVLKNDELAALQEKVGALQASDVVTPVNLEADREQVVPSMVAEALPAPVVVKPVPLMTVAVTDRIAGMGDRGIAMMRNALDELTRNPLIQGMTALVVLLLVSLLWILNRRRRVNAHNSENVSFPTNTPVAPPLKAASTNVIPPETVVPVEFGTDQTPEESDITVENPDDRHEIQLKLLNIYHLTHSKNAFIAQAEALYADLAGEGGALWDKVLVMGREVCPEHPLFGEGSSTGQLFVKPSFTDQDTDISVLANPSRHALAVNDAQEDFSGDRETASLRQSNDTQKDDNSIEFEFSFQAQSLPASAPKVTEDLTTFDLVAAQHEFTAFTERDAFEQQAVAEAGVELELDNSSDKFDSSSYDLDYKFDFDLEKEADLLAKSTMQPDISVNGAHFSGLEFDGGLLVNSDEIGTKLELARAYIEMGDPEGAQDIIDEIMKEGSEDQKQVAQELLQQAG